MIPQLSPYLPDAPLLNFVKVRPYIYTWLYLFSDYHLTAATAGDDLLDRLRVGLDALDDAAAHPYTGVLEALLVGEHSQQVLFVLPPDVPLVRVHHRLQRSVYALQVLVSVDRYRVDSGDDRRDFLLVLRVVVVEGRLETFVFGADSSQYVRCMFIDLHFI